MIDQGIVNNDFIGFEFFLIDLRLLVLSLFHISYDNFQIIIVFMSTMQNSINKAYRLYEESNYFCVVLIFVKCYL